MAAVGDLGCGDGTYCDVLQERQARLEKDRPALQEYASEERAGEYHLCDQAINVSYWETDATDGAEARYRETRQMVASVRESLPERYEEALDLARDAERQARTLPEDERPDMSYTASELEDLHTRATQAAGEPADQALTKSGARKEEYEQQIAQVTDEALMLYEEAGCGE